MELVEKVCSNADCVLVEKVRRNAGCKITAEKGRLQNLKCHKSQSSKDTMVTEGNLSNISHQVDDDSVAASEQKRLTHRKWTMAVRNYVSTDLFKYVQFINRDSDIAYGSGIQKIVCKACNIPETEDLEYWSNHGSDEVMEVLRRKRQTVATSFKARFGSKY
jgi:hypothetical protein